jgi:DNA-binding MarR family transcriptional regulator
MTAQEKIATPCHCALLRKASRHVSQFYDGVLHATGLKTTQLSLMRAVYFRPGRELAMRDLAEILVMDRSTLGHNLRPLEREGLIRLVESKTDRRARIVELTARGRRKCEAAAAGWSEAQRRFEDAFGRARLGALREILYQVASLDFGGSAETAGSA